MLVAVLVMQVVGWMVMEVVADKEGWRHCSAGGEDDGTKHRPSWE